MFSERFAKGFAGAALVFIGYATYAGFAQPGIDFRQHTQRANELQT